MSSRSWSYSLRVRVLGLLGFGLGMGALGGLAHCGGDDEATPGTASPDGSSDDGALLDEEGNPINPDGSSSGYVGDSSLIPDLSASVLRHHKNLARDGVYIEPAFTKAAAATMHKDTSFAGATVNGAVYAQPLYLDRAAANQHDLVFTATEQNEVTAFDATNGAVVWRRTLGTAVATGDLPCGNITPVLGITGTPVIDPATQTLYVDAMTTPDGGTTKKHLIFALDIANQGATVAGWPVDANAVKGPNNLVFDSSVENQRGALMILKDTLYVPYGGHYGDCGAFRGWVIGVPLKNPAAPIAWATRAEGGGTWAPGGLSSDGESVFVTTGNTFGATVWGDGEGLIRLKPDLTFSQANPDYFSPADWKTLDNGDVDIGGSGPIPIDVPGATPSKLLLGLGKDGKAYLADRTNLGGIGGQVAVKKVASGQIINAATAYTTSMGTYVSTRGAGSGCPSGTGSLLTFKIGAAAPPTITVVWCANTGTGSPMTTTTDGQADALVWTVGAQLDNKLKAFDGDTGAVVFNGGAAGDVMATIQRFQTPIAAKGRIFVASNTQLYAFKP